MKQILNDSWWQQLKDEFDKPYYQELREMLKREYAEHTVYPEPNDIYNALHYTSYENVKVVILGQDPYHGPGQAHGLSFSVQPGVNPPPSLKNIFIELQNDIGADIPNHGSLVSWAKQGVLLLNTVLTVRRGQANSHKGKGWEQLTDSIIDVLNKRDKPVVFILWGRHAQMKKERIDTSKHFIIQSPHPSPFSARNGFFGSRPFSRANQYLEQIGDEPIDWSLPNL
ncbi:uracil-DNA glycosylase [Bacillus licheniformis]|uniref:Uracil-DNA glycosylase n=2 Tax=Bacillus licheniformis TaxID=1402 RepID=UNG_BACLD|nr:MULTISPECIES: uracil-DNA glycosylase [Bacillus]Q65DN9.1 RecName: Full=Uracil-DNA glycosylase; Short=UDG [Bacillus licheniformis DSM 13 = ATCC 14580]MBJ7885290.1 uracil-DNA glycosylase [Bacillaceae bacterium HSR45]MBY8348378.1 uracil-DNA glycosylase [Bacillus sp. PCH94]MDP4079987.1 uracil-DNA glycosylase [Bacillota bacterium]HCL0418695.1 uracil-DNA glycosylase [Salmonella enterica subsp. enterica serovar Typhi]AAU25449.1 uracil-DNA glycosylase [Bacillus licheniformis DSM 13 = ATCC 14580]